LPRPYLEKSFTKIGLVEWLKVKALSSKPSTGKKKVLGLELDVVFHACNPSTLGG
jgi:hypothetical protein